MSHRFFQLTLLSIALSTVHSPNLLAAPLRHMHGEGESVSRFQLQRSCQIIASLDDAHWCNPANLADGTRVSAQAEVGARADEKGASIAQQFLFGKQKKRDVEILFREKNFAAVSAFARLETLYKRLSISYTPVHVIAAYRVANPALPEISFAGLNESVFRVQAGTQVAEFHGLEHTFQLNSGFSIYSFNRKTIIFDEQLVNLAFDRNASLGQGQTKNGLDSDLGFTLKNDHRYFPDVAIRVDRLQHSSDKNSYSNEISLSDYETRRSIASLGKVFTLGIGAVGAEVSLPYRDIFREVDSFGASLGLKYSLGGLNSFVSASPLMESFGFLFQGPIYLVGIQYTDEKQPNTFQLKRQRMTYVYAKIHI